MRHVASLSTGFVKASGYATKLRRTLFAQLSNRIKEGSIDSDTVAKKAGELNRLLYIALLGAGVQKDDVVRIRIDYAIKDGDIIWLPETLSIEVYKLAQDASENAASLARRLWGGYTVEILGETETDKIYVVKVGGEVAGALRVTPIGDMARIYGAVLHPPRVIQALVPLPEDLDAYMKEKLYDLIVSEETARPASREEISKVISDIRKLLGSKQ